MLDATLGSPGAVLGLGSKSHLAAGRWRLEDTAGGSGAALGLEVGVILAAGELVESFFVMASCFWPWLETLEPRWLRESWRSCFCSSEQLR